jgi:hypothetical protein
MGKEAAVALCDEVVEQYVSTLHEGFDCRALDEYRTLVGTPYTYADGDGLDVMISRQGDRVNLSDFGASFSRLEMAGLNTESATFQQKVAPILKAFRVDLLGEALRVEGPIANTGDSLLRLIGAMREIDALQVLRPDPRPPRFERRLLTYLKARSPEVIPHPDVDGRSGTRYRLTASYMAHPEPIHIQAIGGGRSETGLRNINYAFRAFSDINGIRTARNKLAVLDEDPKGWRPQDINLLTTVAYVAAWWDRTPMEAYLAGETPEDHRLFETQAEFSDADADSAG